MAREKTEAAEVKLASVGKLEEENATLKTAIEEVKKESVQVKEEKTVLTGKVDQVTQNRNELEEYLGNLAQKMYIVLEVIFPSPSELLRFMSKFCQNTIAYSLHAEMYSDP